jgi:hypothetical protein
VLESQNNYIKDFVVLLGYPIKNSSLPHFNFTLFSIWLWGLEPIYIGVISCSHKFLITKIFGTCLEFKRQLIKLKTLKEALEAPIILFFVIKKLDVDYFTYNRRVLDTFCWLFNMYNVGEMSTLQQQIWFELVYCWLTDVKSDVVWYVDIKLTSLNWHYFILLTKHDFHYCVDVSKCWLCVDETSLNWPLMTKSLFCVP